jgi:Ca2+/H+ antiporter, TMEM165/GDT1 family
MSLAVLATVFGVVFIAELPDKTALASLILGTRYRPGQVFTGVAAAFTVHVVLAVCAGSLLMLLPHRVMQGVVAALFAAGAVLMLRRHEEDDQRGPAVEPRGPGEPGGPGQPGETGVPGAAGGPGPGRGGAATLVRSATPWSAAPKAGARPGFWKVAARSFAVLFVAEFGDLTQLATANLAAHYHQPVTVGIGAVLALWTVGALAITGGRQLLRFVPFAWITRAAALVLGSLAVVSLIAAIAS